MCMREGGRGEREGVEAKRKREEREKGRGEGCLTIPAVCEAVDAVSVAL